MHRQYRVSISTDQRLDGPVAGTIIAELEDLSVPVGELVSVLQRITEPEEDVSREQVTDRPLGSRLPGCSLQMPKQRPLAGRAYHSWPLACKLCTDPKCH